MVELLLPTGVVKDSWDVHRVTALMFAVFNGHAGIVQLILPGSADKDLQDFMARQASSSANPLVLLRALVDAGLSLAARVRKSAAFECLCVFTQAVSDKAQDLRFVQERRGHVGRRKQNSRKNARSWLS